ncbi:HBL064Cp [Eremothecium sinecaudum]|uniref:HBL064Cp n=1 Tax=Eremothecium sinecaudum TaxID=45286 RepID=A0A109UWH5_9SACH|nr:HBL064Cp [Eremothecium sinecaudum]AMD18838.1 HBL064Cp [Eremothecium sinecaudum]
MGTHSNTKIVVSDNKDLLKDLDKFKLGLPEIDKSRQQGGSNILTEANLAIAQKREETKEIVKLEVVASNKKGTEISSEDDKSSVLSKVTSPEGGIEVSELYVSSDAETEKMAVEQEDLNVMKLGSFAEEVKTEIDTGNETDKLIDEPRYNTTKKRHLDEEQKLPIQDSEESHSDEQKFKKPRLPVSSAQVQEEVEPEDNEDEEEEEEETEEEASVKSASVTRREVKKASEGEEEGSSSPADIEKLRQDAMKDIIEIEYDFAELRQRLYENELAKLQTELQMCLDGSHPSLQSYYQMIDSVRDSKLKKAYQRQKYELDCIDIETRATRTFIHQNFYRQVSDIKHRLLNETTQKWYDINKERREMDVLVSEVSYHVPVKVANKTLSCITGYAAPSQLRRPGDPIPEDMACEGINFKYKNNPVDKLEVIVDRMRFNNKLSDLEGLKQYFGGFPGAPSLSGLKDSEIFEDFQNLQQQEQQ